MAEGRYTHQAKDGSQRRVERIDESAAEFYRGYSTDLELPENTNVVIRWNELDTKLESYARDGLGVFDVTTLKKNLLVDTILILMSHGCTEVYDFEITRKGPRTYDERELAHNLKDREFTYRNLVKNDHLERAEKRLVRRSPRVRTLIAVTGAVGVTF